MGGYDLTNHMHQSGHGYHLKNLKYVCYDAF
jgi:hypothetical protein